MLVRTVPTVRLGFPIVGGIELREDAFQVVTCSECGEVADGGNRAIVARAAHIHAEEAHDGLVEREGWV